MVTVYGDILFSRTGFLTMIVWFTLLQSSSAQFCNIFQSEESVQFSQNVKGE